MNHDTSHDSTHKTNAPEGVRVAQAVIANANGGQP
jgi:hypothetical protein